MGQTAYKDFAELRINLIAAPKGLFPNMGKALQLIIIIAPLSS